MQIKKGLNKFVDRVEKMNIYIIFAIILFVQIVFMLYYCNMKQGFFIDEVWSYGLSNSYYHAQIWEDNGLDNVKIDSDMFKSYLTVNKGEEFSYGSVIYNQTRDAHPPLFYLVLHTVSSFFPGQFSKWFGLIPNVVYFAIIMLLLLKISRYISKNNIFNIFILVLYGFSIGAVNSVILIRMYMLLTLWCMAFLLQNIRLYQNEGNIIKQLFLLGIVTFGGMYTQFFFIIFATPIVIIYVGYLLFNKKWKRLLQYCLAGAIGGISAIILFPTYLSKVLGKDGNNANSYMTHTNARNLRDLGSRISVYWGYISSELFGSILIVIISVILISLILFLIGKIFFSFEIVKEKGKKYVTIRKNNTIDEWKIELKFNYIFYISLFCVVVFYFLVVAKITNIYGNRYMMCIYPGVILIIGTLIYGILKLYSLTKVKKAIIMGVCSIMIVGLTYYSADPEYLYPVKGDNSKILEQYEEEPCVFVHYSSFRMLNSAMDLMKFNEVYQIGYNELSEKITKVDNSNPEMILYIDKLVYDWGGVPISECLQEVSEKLGYNNSEKIAEDEMCVVYNLSRNDKESKK